MKMVCQHCKVVFEKTPAEIARGKGKYCSNACSAAARDRKVEGLRALEKSLLRYEKEPTKRRANRIAGRGLKWGLIVKTPCPHCGTNDTEMHHPDYSQPLLVWHVCHKYHMMIHGGDL